MLKNLPKLACTSGLVKNRNTRNTKIDYNDKATGCTVPQRLAEQGNISLVGVIS